MPYPQFAGLALGIVSVGQNLGMFFGPPITGAAVAAAIGVAASVVLQGKRAKVPVIAEIPSL